MLRGDCLGGSHARLASDAAGREAILAPEMERLGLEPSKGYVFSGSGGRKILGFGASATVRLSSPLLRHGSNIYSSIQPRSLGKLLQL